MAMTAHDPRNSTDPWATPRTCGDPLADAVVAELDRLGTPRGRPSTSASGTVRPAWTVWTSRRPTPSPRCWSTWSPAPPGSTP
ncbi:hypothetical protein ACGFWF_35885 [Streptomyces sp. NPDC048581]|uniref:hypothetical protein n=1 Tax=Streptomyces sp. NPDC048581 TaxID=3365572 RepID=UPI00371BB69E